MPNITFPDEILNQIAEFDAIVSEANERKRQILFDFLGIRLSQQDLENMNYWKLITITVQDNQMAVQLNKMVAYMPNIMFVVDADCPLFTLRQGKKKRRIRKDR